MDLARYPVKTDSSHRTYEFLSSGPRGMVKKVVVYQKLQEPIFNLAFGDWNPMKQKIVDDVRTNNGDREKVLATVAATVIDFIAWHPHARILARGRSMGRTRLYQMGINTHLKEINHLFKIEGFVNGHWEPVKPGVNYEAFILQANKKL